MRCKICQNEFIPNKYRPQQQICSQSECQRTRQLQNQRDWRGKNPDYFKCLGQDSAWRESRHRYSKLWKTTHKGYLREYEKDHSQQRSQYMREYMRGYRQKNKQLIINKASNVNGNKS
jgi:hypothetical protein